VSVLFMSCRPDKAAGFAIAGTPPALSGMTRGLLNIIASCRRAGTSHPLLEKVNFVRDFRT